MKTNIFLSLAVASMFVAPAITAAAEPAAYRLSDTRALYIIPFEFQTGSDPFSVPIVAMNGLPFASSEDAVGYSSRQSGALVRTGYVSTALVLSTEDLDLGSLMYEQPEGTRSEYVLVAVLNFPAGMSQRSVGLQLTNIPYIDDEDGDEERRMVAESALRNFRTNEVLLGRSITLTPQAPVVPSTPVVPSAPMK